MTATADDDAAIRPRERLRDALANEGLISPPQCQNGFRRGKMDRRHEKGRGRAHWAGAVSLPSRRVFDKAWLDYAKRAQARLKES
ncbi:MAG: hypothetical protein ACLPSF_13775 [Methylocella sp.]